MLDPDGPEEDPMTDTESSTGTALAALGWVVPRFTYADVLRDPDGVRARVLAVHRARAAQLR
jgi:hypothetical protein